MKKILTFLMLLIGTLAFSTGILKYQILKPAKNPLPEDVKTFAFLFRNITFKADSITKYYTYNEKTLVDTTNYRSKIAQAAYMGFRSVISKHYTLDTVPFLISPETQGNAKRIIPYLEWSKVDTICKKHNADLLVSLEDVSILNNYRTWYYDDLYNGIAEISSFHSWTIYDPLNKNFVFEETKLDTLETHETDYYLEHLIKEKMPHRDEIMEVVAFSTGENLAKKLVPNWQTVYREYYDGGNKYMREAARRVQAKKWKEALQLWEIVKKEAAEKHQARAAFNCAIVNERLGNISQALIDVQQSINLYKKIGRYADERKVAVSLQQILQKRQQEVALLKEQQTKE